MKNLDEEGTIISSIMHDADDSSTIADDNDAADHKDDASSDEPTAKRKRRKKYGQKKIGPIRKGKRQGTYTTYKRVPTPDRKRNKTAIATRVITDVDTDNQQCEGLHLIGGRFVSCITL
jgi:hypothetical protein